MSSIQKIIKYLAIAFAMFLTFNIILGIMSGLIFIGASFSDKDNYDTTEKFKNIGVKDNIKVLDIDVVDTNVFIRTGDTFKIKTSNKNIKFKQKNNTISITEKKHNWFSSGNKSKLIVYVPKDMILDDVSINVDAGKLEVEKLSTKILDLDLGAGKVDINKLTVLNRVKIDGGAGSLTINQSNLNNLVIDMGVGEFKLTSKLSGKIKIDHGIGKLELNLLGEKDDYQIHLDKGLGSVKIDRNFIRDDKTIGNGINRIDINGGVGKIDVNFVK